MHIATQSYLCGRIVRPGVFSASLRVQVVKIVNNLTWNECASFEHSTKVTNTDTVVFVEERDLDADNSDDAEQYNTLNRKAASTAPSEARSRYSVADVPVEVCFLWCICSYQHSGRQSSLQVVYSWHRSTF